MVEICITTYKEPNSIWHDNNGDSYRFSTNNNYNRRKNYDYDNDDFYVDNDYYDYFYDSYRPFEFPYEQLQLG